MTEETQLAVIDAASLPLAFSDDGEIDKIIRKIEHQVKSEAPDVSSAKGRKAIASLAYKVSRSKVALDEAGKALTEDARKKIDAVNKSRRSITERLDKLRDEVRKPLDDWEAAEEERVEGIKARLERLRTAEPKDHSSESIQALITRIEAVALDDSWAEFLSQAAPLKDNRLADLRRDLEAAHKREDDAAELARLRAEAEKRRIADEERAAAEEAARLKAERVEQERLAAERAEAERIEAERAEVERKAQAERERVEAAERATKEAEEKAAAEAKAAEERHAKEMRDAKEREERAAQAERDRIAKEREEEQAAADKRARDQKHRDKIMGDITAALESIDHTDIPAALMAGQIPHTKVTL